MHKKIAAAAVICVWLLVGGSGCEREDEERGPTISMWAVRPHADRGVCTRCHRRVDGAGNAVPAITSAAQIPHMDRGVCSNCHPIAGGGNAPTRRVVGVGRARRARMVRPVLAPPPSRSLGSRTIRSAPASF